MSPYLFSGPRSTLLTLERLMGLLPREKWDVQRHEDRFTPREIVAHLADWEPILRDRIKGGVEEDGYVVTPYDESERAITENYAGTDMEQALRKFRAERQRTLAYIENLTEPQIRRPVFHPELGPLQVVDIMNMLTGHDAYHLEQLSEYFEDKVVGFW